MYIILPELGIRDCQIGLGMRVAREQGAGSVLAFADYIAEYPLRPFALTLAHHFISVKIRR